MKKQAKLTYNSDPDELELELRLLPSLSDLDDYLPASDELSSFEREFKRLELSELS